MKNLLLHKAIVCLGDLKIQRKLSYGVTLQTTWVIGRTDFERVLDHTHHYRYLNAISLLEHIPTLSLYDRLLLFCSAPVNCQAELALES